MYDMKALYQAGSVEEAVALRLEHPEAQIIAGGSDVLVQMREGKRAGADASFEMMQPFSTAKRGNFLSSVVAFNIFLMVFLPFFFCR